VLERHPRLRCAFLEGNLRLAPCGLAPGRGVGEVRPRLGGAGVAAPEPVLLPAVLRGHRRGREGAQAGGRAVGDDNIVVSTDYPHSDGLFPHAIEEFVAIEGVSDKTKAKILWDNCVRLYKLDGGR